MHPPSKFGLFFGGLAEKTQLRENSWPGAPHPASPIRHCLRRFVISCNGLLLEDPNTWLSSTFLQFAAPISRSETEAGDIHCAVAPEAIGSSALCRRSD